MLLTVDTPLSVRSRENHYTCSINTRTIVELSPFTFATVLRRNGKGWVGLPVFVNRRVQSLNLNLWSKVSKDVVYVRVGML